jgi:hypothetical protein
MATAIPSYQQSDTPLPTVAARAARNAIAAGRPQAITFAQSLARWGLNATLVIAIAALFRALTALSPH